MTWRSRLLRLGLLGFLSLTLFQLIKTMWTTYQAGQQVGLLAQEVEVLRQEKQTYDEEVEYRQSNEFVEQEARNRLNLVKPGETVMVIKELEETKPKEELTTARSSSSTPEQWRELLLNGFDLVR